MRDPVDGIKWMQATELRANFWNPNRVHRSELRLLEHSLLATGWIQPILANPSGLIIDGFHRWRLAQESKEMLRRWGGEVPVATLDLTDDEAMCVTVRINRAKGTHVAVEMHLLVAALVDEHGWPVERIAVEIGASAEEVKLLAQEGVFAAKNIASWSYSKAWYPIEDGRKVS